MRVPQTLDMVELAASGSGDGKSLRELIDSSPLAGWLTFVKPDWTFAGPFDFTADLRVPVKPEHEPQVDLTLNFGGMKASLGDMNLELAGLRGPLRYQYPLDIRADRIGGEMFGNPARFSFHTVDGQLRIAFEGRADAVAITEWRKLPNPNVASGVCNFAGEYRIRPGAAQAPVLMVKSDLAGVNIDLPMPLLHQAWAFISPGLYLREKRFAMPLLVSSILLYYLGMLFAYYLVFPIAFKFFASVTPAGVTMMTDINKYLDFAIGLFLAFGFAFEIPIATFLVVATGLTTTQNLVAKRPYVIVGCFVVGAVLTPPDVISQVMLAVPMWALFELGVLFTRLAGVSGAPAQDVSPTET